MSERLSYEKVVSIIEETPCQPNFDRDWFFKNYKSMETDMPLICSCGEPFTLKLKAIKKKGKYEKQCFECMKKAKSKGQKRSFQDVLTFIQDKGCQPLFDEKWFNTSFENENQPLWFQCKCGEPFEKSFQVFRQFPQCFSCGKENQKNATMLSAEEVLMFIKETGCTPLIDKEWLDTHYDAHTCEMSYKCTCGEVFSKPFNLFKKTPHCPSCTTKIRMTCKYDNYEDVLFYLKIQEIEPRFDKNWFDGHFEGTKTILPIQCKCGEPVELAYANIKNIQRIGEIYRCKKCKAKDLRERLFQIDYDHVTQVAKEAECQVAFTKEWFNKRYRNAHTKLKFTCSCGNPFSTTLNGFKLGKQKCSKCGKSESRAEGVVRVLFEDVGVHFKPQLTFDDCRDKYVLPFDFGVFLSESDIENKEKPLFIVELDGLQHSKPVCFGGISKERAMENFLNTQRKDQIKNDYCESNEIPLLRIPFKQFNDKTKRMIEERVLKELQRYRLVQKELLKVEA